MSRRTLPIASLDTTVNSKQAAVLEGVGSDTHFATIVEGNADRSGARLDVQPDHIGIHIAIANKPFWGATAKFKALYRAFWTPA